MEQLTEKQKANRAYYAKNADKIKAKKKADYSEKTGSVRTAPAKKSTKGAPITITSSKPKKAPKKLTASAEDISRMEARRRIEDIMIARELGLDSF